MPFVDISLPGDPGADRITWEDGHLGGEPILINALTRYVAGGGTFELTPEGPVFDQETWKATPEGFHAAVRTMAAWFGMDVQNSDIGDYVGSYDDKLPSPDEAARLIEERA